MHVIRFFTAVPDVVWAALLASGLTLLGVWLSSRSNTRLLLEQLAHGSNEKEKDRIHSLRKEVYLNAAEEMAKANNHLGKLAQLDPSNENLGDGLSDFLAASIKLQLVSEPETAKLANELSTKYGEILLDLLVEVAPIHMHKADIRIASDLYEQNHTEITRILAEMTQLNESGQPDSARFEALQRSAASSQQAIEHFAKESSNAHKQHNQALHTYTIYLLKKLRSVSQLQMQLTIAIRNELALTTDPSEFEARLHENLERMDRAMHSLLEKLEAN